jgi:hypothetical protein
MSENHQFSCPHCGGEILVIDGDIACGIFRHGVFKHNGEQIPPHSAKTECDLFVAEGKIFGCGKPFRVTRGGSGIIIEICDYI